MSLKSRWKPFGFIGFLILSSFLLFQNFSLIPIGPTENGIWVIHSLERSSFKLSGPAWVRYGQSGQYITKYFQAGTIIPCSNQFFGHDPVPTILKRCEVFESRSQASNYQSLFWKRVATEWSTADVGSDVKVVSYGTLTNRVYLEVKGRFVCSNEFFGMDPAPNVDKSCYVSADPQQADFDYMGALSACLKLRPDSSGYKKINHAFSSELLKVGSNWFKNSAGEERKNLIQFPFSGQRATGLYTPQSYGLFELSSEVVDQEFIKNQPLINCGLVDVSKYPFDARRSKLQNHELSYSLEEIQNIDNSDSFERALDFARRHMLAVYVPSGTYLVKRPISCTQGQLFLRPVKKDGVVVGENIASDRQGACILVGDSFDRPVIKIDPLSESFNLNEVKSIQKSFLASGGKTELKTIDVVGQPVIRIASRGNEQASEVKTNQAAASYNHVIQHIDFDLSGKAGAVAIEMSAAQGTQLQDVSIEATGAFAGLQGGIGSGGLTGNIRINGGQYGIIVAGAVYTSEDNSKKIVEGAGVQSGGVYVGIEIYNPTKHAILIRDATPESLNFVGMSIFMGKKLSSVDNSAIKVDPLLPFSASQALVLNDVSIDFSESSENNIAIETERGVYARNLYVKNSPTILSKLALEVGRHSQILRTAVLASAPVHQTRWQKFSELALAIQPNSIIASDGTTKLQANQLIVQLDRASQFQKVQKQVLLNQQHQLLNSGALLMAPPNDLLLKHLWSDRYNYELDSLYSINIKERYLVYGDGVTDDHAQIQKALNDISRDPNQMTKTVFFPKGYYALSKPLILPYNVKLVGVARHLTQFMPHASWKAVSGATQSQPLPLLISNQQRDAVNMIYKISFLVPFDDPSVLAFNWQSGDRSIVRQVSVYLESFGVSKEKFEKLAPLVTISQNGGGKWYAFEQGCDPITSVENKQVHLAISNANVSPIRLYATNLESNHDTQLKAALTIENSSNIIIYGLKSEQQGNKSLLKVSGSNNIHFFGYSGMGTVKTHAESPTSALFDIDSASFNITIASVTNRFYTTEEISSPSPRLGAWMPIGNSGKCYGILDDKSCFSDRPILFKKGDTLDLNQPRYTP